MEEHYRERIKSKLKELKTNNQFYKEKYKNLDLDLLKKPDDFDKLIPFIDKSEVFTKENIGKIFDFGDGIISPSAGTTAGKFSFRYTLNGTSTEFNQQLIQIIDLWFGIKQKKTLIINAYPMGVTLPEGPYTVINTTTRTDVIVYALDYLAEEFENVIIVGQPHFIKHLIDLPDFKAIRINRDHIKLILGGSWFPYTFEIYLLKSIHGNSWMNHTDSIKSTYGTAETGLGVLIDLPKNVRAMFSKNQLNEMIPLVYTFDPNSFYLEVVDGSLVITTLRISNPELIRYKTEDKAAFLSADKLPEPLKVLNIGNIVLLYGRGESYDRNSRIAHNLFYNYEYAKNITGNFYLEGGTLFIQLGSGLKKGKSIDEYFRSIFNYKIEIQECDNYKYKSELERKPLIK